MNVSARLRAEPTALEREAAPAPTDGSAFGSVFAALLQPSQSPAAPVEQAGADAPQTDAVTGAMDTSTPAPAVAAPALGASAASTPMAAEGVPEGVAPEAAPLPLQAAQALPDPGQQPDAVAGRTQPVPAIAQGDVAEVREEGGTTSATGNAAAAPEPDSAAQPTIAAVHVEPAAMDDATAADAVARLAEPDAQPDATRPAATVQPGEEGIPAVVDASETSLPEAPERGEPSADEAAPVATPGASVLGSDAGGSQEGAGQESGQPHDGQPQTPPAQQPFTVAETDGIAVPSDGKEVRDATTVAPAAEEVAPPEAEAVALLPEPSALPDTSVVEPPLVAEREAPALPSAPAPREGVPTPAQTPETARTRPTAALLDRWQADLQSMVTELSTDAGGWQRLRLRLDDDSGTMTLRARREADHVAVNVAFSDPLVRQAAQASAERLHTALEAQLGQQVAFSFGEGGRDAHHHTASDRDPSPFASTTASDADRTLPPPRPGASGKREWIG